MIFSALIVKFLSAGAVAQAATGATVAVVAFTGVGAVGALPDPVQDTFATVVAEITPLEPPTSEEPTEEVVPEEGVVEEVETPEAGTDEAEAGVVDVAAWIEAGPEGYDSFGEWVSASATNTDLREALRAEGKNFGSVISKWAHDKGYDEDDLAAEGVNLDELTDAPTDPVADEVADEVSETDDTEVAATTVDRGSRGNGNGNGNGKATGGNGGGSSNGGGNGGGSGNGGGNAKN